MTAQSDRANPNLLHELFARAAREHRDRCAIEIPPSVDRPTRIRKSYAELDADAERIARLLTARVTTECVVAIVLPRTSPLALAAQLGVLRAGAAFVCPDVGWPDDAIRFVLGDADVVAVLTDAEGRARLGSTSSAPILDVFDGVDEAAEGSSSAQRATWLTPSTLAYVIYTSGTTGRPKGVMIEHGSIVNLIEREREHFDLCPTDRCVQVSSPAYDSSIEESWLPLAAGATVVIADEDTTRLGPDLVPWLRDVGATVWMPTPTLLRMTGCADPASALPGLRLVYVGGEAMPQDLIDRWAPGRWLENGYGPTECTVTVVRGRLSPGGPAIIGKPIPGNTAWVLDEAFRPVPDGEVGELCIAGVGLARGYLRRAELTAERFPTLPGLGRVYRTGDLVRRDEAGDLHYLGRADSQVKLRGYRIELEAIEARLAELDSVQAAACRVVRATSGAADRLEAFVVPSDPSCPPTAETLDAALRASLPGYMVPVRFTPIDSLPTSTGGKLDRRSLPEAETPAATRAADDNGATDLDPLEAAIAAALGAPFEIEALGVDQDFFARGGDSLSVAIAVSVLRDDEQTASLSARDVYELRTVRRLAERARARLVSTGEPAATAHAGARETLRDGALPLLVTCAQTIWLLASLSAASLVAYALAFWLLPWLVVTVGLVPLLVLSPLVSLLGLALYTPLALVLAVATKRVLIGRYRATRVPVWSGFYLRHWIVQRAVQLVPWRVLQGTVFYNAALRAFGARIGERVHVHRGVDLLAGGWDLLTIGDDVTLCQDASVGLVHLDDGELVLGPVTLEDRCTLEVRAGVGEHTVVGRDAELSALSYLPAGRAIEAAARFDGIPARRVASVDAVPSPTESSGRILSPARHGATLIVAGMLLRGAIALPGLALLALLVVVLGIEDIAAADWVRAPSSSISAIAAVLLLAGLSVPGWLLTQAVALRMTATVPTGTISRWSTAYIRVWLRTGLLDAAGRWLAGSLYWRWWLRLAGMHMGRNCEVSTIVDVLPEHVRIGDECFFADGIYLGGPRVRRGVVTMAEVEFGARVFLGNHVVVPPGTHLPSDMLLGIATVADAARMRSGTSWFGHPAFELPRREVVECDRTLTHDPTPFLFGHRLAWETLRFALPVAPMAGLLAWLQLSFAFSVALTPLVSLGVAATLALSICALKWSLLGRVRPGQHGFWSLWCCRWDFLYMAWGMVAGGLLAPLSGTLLLPWYLRLMGVRIGRRVVLGGSFAQVVDPDMLTFADHATIDSPMFQAHTFEDRVLKIGRVTIGRAATVRRGAVLLYGADLGAGCHVAPHSVVMKNETLAPGRRYEGAPAGEESSA